MGLAAYVSLLNSGFWIWVGTSAYFGIRDEQNFGLGLISTALALAPLLIAGLVILHGLRRGLSRIRAWRRGCVVALLTAIPPLLLAMAMTVI